MVHTDSSRPNFVRWTGVHDDVIARVANTVSRCRTAATARRSEIAAILALVLAIAAPNKVAGCAVVKVMNAVNLLPVVAYFVPRPLQFIAGVFPTYWPMRALWSAVARESYGAHLMIGAVISGLALLLAVWLFDRRLLRRA